MPTKVLATQYDPQYGYVTADPLQSQGYTGIQDAANLYKQMYGWDLSSDFAPILSPNYVPTIKNVNDPIQKVTVGQKVQHSTPESNLMDWYRLATNADYIKDPAAADFLKFAAQSMALERPQTPYRGFTWDGSTYARPDPYSTYSGGAVGSIFGMVPDVIREGDRSGLVSPLLPGSYHAHSAAAAANEAANFAKKYGSQISYDNILQYEDLVKKYGVEGVANAYHATLGNTGTGQSAMGSRANFIGSPSLGMAGPATKAPLAVLEAQEALRQQQAGSGGVSAAYKQYFGDNNDIRRGGYGDLTSAAKALDDARRAEGIVSSVDLMRRNPSMYNDASLMRYFEGPNATLVSNEGGPWTATFGSNRSKTLGGEDLTDDVFKYYQNQATQGQLGSFSGVQGNPYLQQGTFNGSQAYFTPYDYAISGIYDPSVGQRGATNVANVSPEYWDQHGNLQKIGDKWGFVTQDNPFANMADYNKVVDPEKVQLKYKYDTGGGGIGGIGGGLLSAASFIGKMIPGPWTVPLQVLSTMNTLANVSGSRAPNMPPAVGKIRPVFAPNPTGGALTQVITPDYVKAVQDYNLKAAKKGLPQKQVPSLGNYTAPTSGAGWTPPQQGSMNTQALTDWYNPVTKERYQTPTGGWTPPSNDWVIGNGSSLSQPTINNGLSVPQPGDPDYPAYAQALASGREWDYRT